MASLWEANRPPSGTVKQVVSARREVIGPTEEAIAIVFLNEEDVPVTLPSE